MRPVLKSLLGSAAAVSNLLCSGLAVSANSSIELEIDPPLSEVVPFSEVTTLSLTALDSRGQPLEAANFDLTLLTPPQTPWATSDFPMVEGTTLFEVALPAAAGTAQFETMMPIRGTYQLQVAVSPQVPGSFEPYTEVLTLPVPENPIKYRNVAILLGVLFAAGLGGGWVIGGDQTVNAGETAPRRVQWLLSGTALVAIAVMFYMSVKAERAEAHVSGHSHDAVQPEAVSAPPVPENITAEINDLAIATVGQATPLLVTVVDASSNPIDNAVLSINTQMAGHGTSVMSFVAQSNAKGEFRWRQQFFDGAPHRIVVDVAPAPGSEPKFEPFTLTKTIDVKGIAPPVATRLITLVYFTAVLGLGTAVGYGLRRQSSRTACQ